MVIFQRGKAITILYAVRGFRTGQIVTCVVYKSNGDIAKASHNMTEIGSTGVYSSSFMPQNVATYFSVCDCAAYPLKTYKEYHVVKEFVKGGVILKPQPVFTGKEKEKLFAGLSKLREISAEQNYTMDLKEIQMLIAQHKESSTQDKALLLKEFSKGIGEIRLEKTETAELMESKLDETKLLNDKEIKRSFSKLSNEFKEEVTKISQETILSRLEDLKTVSNQLIQVLDETNANVKLSNEFFNSNLKNKIELFSQNADELTLLLKNVN